MAHSKNTKKPSVATALTLPSGPVDLSRIDTEGRSTGPQSKKKAAKALQDIGATLADLQEKLYAQGLAGNSRRVLLILQGMDTSGKDGVVKHVVGLMNPAGLHLASFKKPTPEEQAHDFLWRIEKQVPAAGMVGVFNRSQYEDVLVVRVHNLVPAEVWSKRFDAINEFERKLTDDGVKVVKCFLHISSDVQKERLAARLEDPTKYWKYNPGDVDERGYWTDYQRAYADALHRCSTDDAPWYIVPGDRKWYRNWAVAALLAEILQGLHPTYPPAGFDLDTERTRVAGS